MHGALEETSIEVKEEGSQQQAVTSTSIPDVSSTKVDAHSVSSKATISTPVQLKIGDFQM